MPWIAPEGFLNGERIASLSDEAMKLWPFLYLASNGYGRFQVDYLALSGAAFKNLREKPTERQLRDLLREYRDKYLLFLYTAPDGTRWAAWDSKSGQKYYSNSDKQSPAPPEKDFQAWREGYKRKKAETIKQSVEFADDLFGTTSSAHNQPSLGQNKTLFSESADIGQDLPVLPESSVEDPAPFYTTSTQYSNTSIQQKVLITTQQEVLHATPISQSPELSPTLAPTLPTPVAFRYAPDIADESFPEFYAIALAVGMNASDEEWRDIQFLHWRRMSFEDRLYSIHGIRDRMSTEYADPAMVPFAVNYIAKRLWTRPLRPPRQGPQLVKKPVDTSYLDAVKAEAAARKKAAQQ